MKLIGLEVIEAFKKKDLKASKPLDRFVTVIQHAKCKNLADLKKVFGSVDAVGKQTVFNVGGNKYRVIAKIVYGVLELVSVTHVMNHKEYDQGKWKE